MSSTSQAPLLEQTPASLEGDTEEVLLAPLARLSLAQPPALAASTAATAAVSPTQRFFPFVVVDTIEKLAAAIDGLEGATHIALDAEGVDLSRVGLMTVLVLKRIDLASSVPSPAFLVDLHELGGPGRAFSSPEGQALKRLVESSTALRVTFDCRTDSDALWHQFGVRLTNVLDLQVYDQGVRLHYGEPPPRRNGSWVPYVTGMAKVGPRYVDRADFRALDVSPAPHKLDANAWAKRPLSDRAWAYAANDAHLIDLMFRAMEAKEITLHLKSRVALHSDRYVRVFRDHRQVVTWDSHKTLVMEERNILLEP